MTPDLLEGERADARLAQQARATTPRRALAALPGFADASPEVGRLDAAAVDEALDRDPDGALELVTALTGATDPALRDAARRLAARLFWRPDPRAPTTAGGVGRLETLRRQPLEGDVDIDRSLEPLLHGLASGSAPDAEQLWTRHWRRPATTWCLLLDTSGSMRGRALATAALTTAAFLLRAGPDRLVLSFAADVVVLSSPTDGASPTEVLDRVLCLRGGGTTDLAGALRAGAERLAGSASARRVTLLLSDCRATRPEDVAAAAALHPELRVLAPDDAPAAALALADATGARVETIGGPSAVPDAMARLLA